MIILNSTNFSTFWEKSHLIFQYKKIGKKKEKKKEKKSMFLLEH
jgi:hypothetical protein